MRQRRRPASGAGVLRHEVGGSGAGRVSESAPSGRGLWTRRSSGVSTRAHSGQFRRTRAPRIGRALVTRQGSGRTRSLLLARPLAAPRGMGTTLEPRLGAHTSRARLGRHQPLAGCTNHCRSGRAHCAAASLAHALGISWGRRWCRVRRGLGPASPHGLVRRPPLRQSRQPEPWQT